MGDVTKGRVIGYGPRVFAKDLNNMHYPSDSQVIKELRNTVHTLKNEIAHIKAKDAEQASQHGSNCNSLQGTRQNVVSPTLGDADSVSNIGVPIERRPPTSLRGTTTPVNGNNTTLHSKQVVPTPLGGTNTPVNRISTTPLHYKELVSSPLSGTNTPVNHTIPTPSHYKEPVSTPLGGTTAIPCHAQVATIKSNPVQQVNAIQNHGLQDQAQSKRIKLNELTWNELENVVDKVISTNPDPVRKYIRGDKTKKEMSLCFLAGMAMNESKKRANAQMLDKLLCVKLQRMEKQVATKERQRQSQVAHASIQKQS